MKFRILIASLVLFFACTTIELDENHNVPKAYSIDSVFYEETPPASINPLIIEIWMADYKRSLLRWRLAVRGKIKWLKENGYIPVEPIKIHVYANDGLNWRRWDIEKAVIYYEENNGN